MRAMMMRYDGYELETKASRLHTGAAVAFWVLILSSVAASIGLSIAVGGLPKATAEASGFTFVLSLVVLTALSYLATAPLRLMAWAALCLAQMQQNTAALAVLAADAEKSSKPNGGRGLG